jgi:hypothetical protein
VLLVSIIALAGCTSGEFSRKCSEAIADADCPPGTAARIESAYDRDISGIDELRCLEMGAAAPKHTRIADTNSVETAGMLARRRNRVPS